MTFGERLQHARLTQGLTQVELASRSNGLMQQEISHYEKDHCKPSFKKLRRMAKGLNITSDYLLDLPYSPEIEKNTHRTKSSEESLDYYSLRVRRWKTQ